MSNFEPKEHVYHPSGLGVVGRVIVKGLEKTRLDLITRELEILKSLRTIEDVHGALETVHEELMALGVFECVDILIDESEQSEGELEVLLQVYESGMLSVKAGTYVQGSEGRSSTLSSGTVETSINLKNLFGFADLLTLTLEKGLSQSNVYSISGSVPKFLDSPYRVECKIHQIFQDRQKWSSYVERFRGGSISLSKGQSAIVYECGWRRISDPSRRASNEILSSLGDTIKSSLSLSHAMHDLIRNPRLETSVINTLEFGDIGVNTILGYMKYTFSGQLRYELRKGIDFFAQYNAGQIFLVDRNNFVGPSDRFYLGGLGTNGIRGFMNNGIGPMGVRRCRKAPKGERSHDALGGSSMASMLGALRFQFPSPALSAMGLQSQLFINFGTLKNSSFSNGIWNLNGFKTIASDVRASIGAGIVWPLKIGVLELNLCRVIARGPDDYGKTGLQFGITPF